VARLGTRWAPVALFIVLAAGAALYATGHLAIRWQPDASTPADGHAHEGDGKEQHEDGRVKSELVRPGPLDSRNRLP
jgi:hypothetical protein